MRSSHDEADDEICQRSLKLKLKRVPHLPVRALSFEWAQHLGEREKVAIQQFFFRFADDGISGGARGEQAGGSCPPWTLRDL